MKRLSRGAAFSAALAMTCVPLTAVAAPAGPSAGQTTGAVSSADPKEPGFAAEENRADEVHAKLKLSAQQGLVVRNLAAGPGDTTTVRYDRTYKGLRVLGGDVIVTRSASGEIVDKKFNASGTIAVGSIDPGLSRKQALRKGEGRAADEGIAKGESEDHESELVVFAQGEKPVLAYDVLTTGVQEDQTPSRLHTIVDASSGEVLASWDEIKTGTGESMYVGSVDFETTASGGSYEMRDSHGNYTTDMNNSQSGSGQLFTDNDDQWGNGSASSDQTAGVDAQYGAQMTYEYYEQVHDRAGIWDNGEGARSRVHYGNQYVNAFWDGTQMTYGDGRNNQHPLTSLDVAAHEMTHGVTEATAGLVYYGDAGGLNESTSDIFAAAMEFHSANSADIGDYMVGEQIDINGNGTPLRYMDQPSKDGSSYDCYSSAVSDADPHYSSGPLNHWFFLASQGSGSSTVNGVEYNSPTCDGSTVEAVGREAAAEVWYRTLDTKLTSGSTYTDARDGAVESAMELYGDGSTECHGIQDAFDAITVPRGAVECAPLDGGGDPGPDPDPQPGAVDIPLEDALAHVDEFQQIADDNGGNRATGTTGYQASVDYVVGQLEGAGYDVHVQEFSTTSGTSKNVVATLPGGSGEHVVMLGAHLDSVARGAGINDNGSGSAGALEIALNLAERDVEPTATMKFAFWGAEEQGLLGSTHYVDSLGQPEIESFEAYVNADMIGSPNIGYFVYDDNPNGNFIRDDLAGLFEAAGIDSDHVDVNGRSDHASFIDSGVPTSGVFSGAEGTKSSAQASKWGGTAGQAYDSCYHSACDDRGNLDEEGMDTHMDVLGSLVFDYADNWGDDGTDPDPEPSDAVTNGSFEDGASGWSGDTGTINDLGTGAHSGQYKAYLVGYGSRKQEGIRQQVSVPKGGELAFHLRVDTDESTWWGAYDTMKVNVLDSSGDPIETMATYSNLDASSSYAQHTLDMSRYAGQDVTIEFIGQEDVRYQTSFLVDDVSLQ
ncbi:M28 family peptidase [Janibacter cremeus]|uniref:Zn-dependent metalloprotease n=1 Tax=Janibacter cremeus TaxID=1285192 RepID=A0A852VV26_9MICO|nr:Zn-dependent metalloprotease [Janibacter cremeus]